MHSSLRFLWLPNADLGRQSLRPSSLGDQVMTMRQKHSAWVMFALCVVAGSALAAEPLEIRVLSSKPEFVSGGDALIEIKASGETKLDGVTLTVNGEDQTKALAADAASKSLRGEVKGLKAGQNTLVAVATTPARVEARATLTNYPITGPILSGPHLTPYECRTNESGLGAPLDADCSAPQSVEYFYKVADGSFKPMADLK